MLSIQNLIDRYNRGERNFEQSKFHRGNFAHCCLHGIDLSESILCHADFSHADLRGQIWVGQTYLTPTWKGRI